MTKLTEREQQIILGIAKGYDKHACLARDLCINLNTLNAHLCTIYRKTGTHNQVQLIRWAWREAARGGYTPPKEGTCDENAETTGADNGSVSPTAQATEQPYAGDGSNRGKP